MFKLSELLNKFRSIQPISKDLQDISDIIQQTTNINIPVEKISMQKGIIRLDIEQIKKTVIFRKETQIKEKIQEVLNFRIDKIL